jgi:hypothetical protein
VAGDLLFSDRDGMGRRNPMIVVMKQWDSTRRTDSSNGVVPSRLKDTPSCLTNVGSLLPSEFHDNNDNQ